MEKKLRVEGESYFRIEGEELKNFRLSVNKVYAQIEGRRAEKLPKRRERYYRLFRRNGADFESLDRPWSGPPCKNATSPRLDWFSRGSHDGFDSWGNEKGKFDERGL